MKFVRLLLINALCISGCATIVSQSSWPVTIKSSDFPATFTIINNRGQEIHRGVTPETVMLHSGSGYFQAATYPIKFSTTEGKESCAVIESTLNGWYWGNILFGGLIGFLIIDPGTGAMWALPDVINAP